MNTQILLTSLSLDEFKSLIDESVKNALIDLKSAEQVQREDQLIKIDEVCNILHVSRVTVHAWKKAGKLPFYRISNKIYFKKNEVIDALRKIEKRTV